MSMRTNRLAPALLAAAACALTFPACSDTGTTEARVEPLALRVEPAAMTLDAAQKAQLRLLNGNGTLPADAKILWETSDATIVTVDQNGIIEAVAPGEATITGTVAYGPGNGRGNARIKVVQPAASRLVVSPEVVYIPAGALTQLTFTAYDAAGNIMAGAQPKWSTSSPAVATVDVLGRVTGKKAGIANIRAEYGGMTAGAVAAVAGAVPPAIGGITVTPGSATISAGDSVLATVAVTDTAGRPVEDALVTWASSNSKVAQVNGAGVVRGLLAGTAIITAAAGGRSSNLSVAVTQPVAQVVSVVVSPHQDTIRAIGFTRQLTATARDAQGNVVTGAAISWTSLNPSIVTVTESGSVTARAAGMALVVAAAAGCSGCKADTAIVSVLQEAAAVEVSPATLSLQVGGSSKLTWAVRDAGGSFIPNAQVTWSAAPQGIVSVASDGTVGGVAPGTATVTASINGKTAQTTVTVGQASPPPPGSAGDLVLFPNDQVAFIIGPQVRPGSASSPWAFFDDNAQVKGHQHGTAFPRTPPAFLISGTVAATQGSRTVRGSGTRFASERPAGGVGLYIVDGDNLPWYFDSFDVVSETEIRLPHEFGGRTTSGARARYVSGPVADTYANRNYYDQGLAQYTNYYRTGDPAFLEYARKITDSWYDHISVFGARPNFQSVNIPPRMVAMSGLILRALDGRPDMWTWITEYARFHYDIWLGARLNNSQLHYGVRDGGMALTYVAQLAKAHPDAAVRAEMLDKSLRAARDYYARLQHSDGGWYWLVEELGGNYGQPMMIGLMVEGLVATHQLTGDPTVGQSLVRAAGWLYNTAYERQFTTNLPDVRWRAMAYARNINGGDQLRTSAYEYGQPAGAIGDARQLNPHTVHVLGYAYKLTGDPKYREWGDDIFSATFGKGSGSGADKYGGLADYREKEYNQSYRSAGRYLAWRLQ